MRRITYRVMFTRRPIVSSCFRNDIASALPGLALDPSTYWPLLALIAFPTWRDEATDQIIMGNRILSAALGRERENDRRKFSGRDVLGAFARDVFPLEWTHTNWDVVGGPMRARRISLVGWPPQVRDLVERERRTRGGPWVYLDDGDPFTASKAKDLRALNRSEAAELAAQRGCDATSRLVAYLNELPPNRFSKLRAGLPEAHDLVDRIGRDVDRQHDLLRALEIQSLPIYAPAPSTSRVFAMNDSILGLKREVRGLLTRGWHHADLRSCQLAIAARLWDVPEVDDYLRSGANVWEDLTAWMGLPLETGKRLVKGAMYGIVYGQGRDGRRRAFDAALGRGHECQRRFLAHPLVRAMLVRRGRTMKAIERAGGAVDCFGRSMAVVDVTVDPRRPRTNIPSIMAMMAQAEETALLLPALELAEAELTRSKPGFLVTMWLHDGFSIDVSDERAALRWRDRLKAVVDEEARARGYATELTW